MTHANDEGQPVIQIENLSLRFPSAEGSVPAVRELSYAISPGSINGILGESGSGKSVSSLSLANLVSGGIRDADCLEFRGRNLMRMGEAELSSLRGEEIAYIFQNPRESLNPYATIGTQFRQLLRGEQLGKDEMNHRIHRALQEAGLPEAEQILEMHPHQLSGGQNQRVNIAMALLLRADVIIADEPTSAVDSHLRGQILSLLERINREHGTTMLVITHDFAVIRRLCSRVLVMYGGLLVEDGPVEEIMTAPRHPYTRELLQCSASLESAAGSLTPAESSAKRVYSLKGTPPRPGDYGDHCPFVPRCRYARDICSSALPGMQETGNGGHGFRCIHSQIPAPALGTETLNPAHHRAVASAPAEAAGSAGLPSAGAPAASEAHSPSASGLDRREPVLEARGISKHFLIQTNPFRPPGRIDALKDVNLRLYKGEVLGLVGESGSGKSTLGSILTALQTPDSGEVLFKERDIFALRPHELRNIRKDLQLIFQQSGSVLDPRMTTGAILSEALSLHNICPRENQRNELERLLSLVGLHEDTLRRYPGELSGGMLQRVIIARAVSTRPSVIICDEPVSALDVSVQGQVLNLLKDLQEELGLSYIFISHDIDVIAHMADRVAVLESGTLREEDN